MFFDNRMKNRIVLNKLYFFLNFNKNKSLYEIYKKLVILLKEQALTNKNYWLYFISDRKSNYNNY
jgi:hypothetical protein